MIQATKMTQPDDKVIDSSFGTNGGNGRVGLIAEVVRPRFKTSLQSELHRRRTSKSLTKVQ